MKTTMNLEEHNSMKEKREKKIKSKDKDKNIEKDLLGNKKNKKSLIRVIIMEYLGITIKTINMIMKKIFTNHTKLIKAYENINFHTLVLIYSDNISKASFAIS